MKKQFFLMFVSIAFFSTTLMFSTQSIAQSAFKVMVKTGNDDLRGGNRAFMTIHFTDNTSSAEIDLGGGFGKNSVTTRTVSCRNAVGDVSSIKNIVIRHDGAPRAGQPFDTYDNWDLQQMRIWLVRPNGDKIVIDETLNPVIRFTGQLRNHTFTPKQGGPAPPSAETKKLKIYITTGSDDLRGGNNAYITVNYMDGTSSSEMSLGGGFGQNSAVTKMVDLPKAVDNPAKIKNIVIRHDGSPRAGQPFDTYDNWDLQVLRVALVMPNGSEQNIVNVRGNPLKRFTGAERNEKYDRRP